MPYGKRKRKRHFCGNRFKKVKHVTGEVLDVRAAGRNADTEECARVNSTDNSQACPSDLPKLFLCYAHSVRNEAFTIMSVILLFLVILIVLMTML